MRYQIALSVLALGITAAPVQAQLAVIDNANLVRTIETARNTLEQIRKAEQQIQEAQRLYDSVNGVTDIQDVARVLDNRTLRGALPDGVSDVAAYVSDDLSDLGQISSRAEQIYGASNFRSGVASADQSLAILGRRASRDRALSEYSLDLAEERAEGLGVLEDRLATATTQREIDEISARGSIETAAAVNELNRQMALQRQQEAEKQRLSVERAAAAAAAFEEGVRRRKDNWGY